MPVNICAVPETRGILQKITLPETYSDRVI